MRRFIEVYDRIGGGKILLNIDHIVYLDLGTGQIMLDCSRAINLDKNYIEVVKKYIEDDNKGS